MCGRFNVDDEGLDDAYESLVGQPFPGALNHNTAPTESAWIIRAKGDGAFEAAEAKWWLTPYWSRVAQPRYATFNARAETLATSRTFREPFRRRRCVVPVSGFYEWRRRVQSSLFDDDGGGAGSRGAGKPYYVRPRHGALLLAGVWDRWRQGEASLDSFAIVTTAASDKLAFLHHRQPLLLASADARVWLGAAVESDDLTALLAPRVPVELLAAPVARRVGDARDKDRRCAAPVGDAAVIAPDP